MPTTSGACSCSVIQENKFSETNSSRRAQLDERHQCLISTEKRKMRLANYSDQLIFCINTQDSGAVVLLNRLDVNKNLRRFAATTFPQGLANKAPEILFFFSCMTHWCCFYGFVLPINQCGHQVQVLTKINVGNNVLCIGHSVGFCREHTCEQTAFRPRV